MKKNEAAESARLAVLLTDILLSQQLGQKIPAKGAAFERLVVDYLMDNASYIDSCRKSSSADWFRGLVPRIGSADWFRGLVPRIGSADWPRRLVCQICGVRPESLGLRWVATRAFLQFALCV
jgi:hypothetical protein